MRKATLLFLISSDKHTGPGRVALLHAKLLAEAGHRVRFACQPGGTLQAAAEDRGVWFDHALHLPTRGQAWALALDGLRLRSLIKREAVEAVFTYRSAEHVTAGLALPARQPLVRFVHAPLDAYDRCHWPVPGAIRRLLTDRRTTHLLTPHPLELARLHCLREGLPPDFGDDTQLGPWIARQIAGRGVESAVTWTPGGVDTLHFTPDRGGAAIRRELGLSDDQVVVGLVARMKWGRGHYGFLKAFARAAAQEPRLRALLIGDGEEKPKIAETCAAEGVADKVAFFDPGGRYEEALAAIDVGFLWAPGSAGTAQAALELKSMARPMVMPDTGVFGLMKTTVGAGEEAGDGPTVLDLATNGSQPDFDTDEALIEIFSSAFVTLARDPDLRLETGQAGRTLVEQRFSRAVLQRSLVALTERLLTASNATARADTPSSNRSA